MPLNSYAEAQWPKDRPLPTEEEINLAQERWMAQSEKMYASGYTGDWGFSWNLLTGTYAAFTWLHLFFPDETFSFPEENLGSDLT